MSGRKTIAVIGATGAQGGGLVRAILSDPKGDFSARVLTRDVNGARAKDFARLGAEVVNADIDNSESLKESIRRRLRGLLRNLFLPSTKNSANRSFMLNPARTMLSVAAVAMPSSLISTFFPYAKVFKPRL